jgi:hypothetical protein
MATLTYEKSITALIVVDPYNDFISEEARHGTAFGALQKPMTAFLICYRF